MITGVLGGSGVYDLEQLTDRKEVALNTPFGPPSDTFTTGRIGDRQLVFLARHGRGHRLHPTEINARANIFGMKMLGVERLVSVSAVGSLHEDIQPGDMVIVDQFIDWTRHRQGTFFGDGIAGHVEFSDPVCAPLARWLGEASAASGVRTHRTGTYLCMEGPLFSTRAESNLYRQWGATIVGMTNMPEAKLAREAEICYATLALATDYDSWHKTEASVSVDAILAVIQKNVTRAKAIVGDTISRIETTRTCGCARAAEHAIVTQRALISRSMRDKVAPLWGRYLD